MSYGILGALVKNLIGAWQRRDRQNNVVWIYRIAIATGLAGSAYSIVDFIVAWSKGIAVLNWLGVGSAVVSTLLLLFTAGIEEQRENAEADQRIRDARDEALAHPEKPQLAWDAARKILEQYMDRNLDQGKAIFRLTVSVMVGSFGLVIFGLFQALNYSEKTLSVVTVSAASGVLLSFVSGSFLFVFRSVVAQSGTYVQILDRVNAVGMAVQISQSIADDGGTLRAETAAALAKDLLAMYGVVHGHAGPDQR